MLIIFGGLPGVGKTAIARELSRRLDAVFLRIDSLEQALVRSGIVKMEQIGPGGYYAAQALARDNLALGRTVVADSVNPYRITRKTWRDAAVSLGKRALEVEVVCSDREEHRRRVERRVSDIPDLTLPTWEQVLKREYEPWPEAAVRLDTALLSVERAMETILKAI